MKEIISKKQIKTEWKNFLKNEEFIDYFSIYKAIQNTTRNIMLQMVDFLFIDDIYVAFLEMIELNNNIEIMITSKSQETVTLCKERVDWLIKYKVENWWL